MAEDSERPRILLTGASGYVGSFLLDNLQGLGDVFAASRSACPHRLDITDGAACARLLSELRPSVVVHAAAMSSPAECERDAESAWRANAPAAFVEAVAAYDASTRFVLLSTDQVHGGESHLVDEAHPAEPINVYGRTKLAMEGLVREKLPRHALLRLSFVYGPERQGAHKTFLQFAAERLGSKERFSAFTDQVRSAVYVRDVVDAVRLAATGDLTGCVNVGGPEALSRLDFCSVVAQELGLSAESMEAALSTEAKGPPAPRDISMAVAKLAGALGRQPMSLREALADMGMAGPRL